IGNELLGLLAQDVGRVVRFGAVVGHRDAVLDQLVGEIVRSLERPPHGPPDGDVGRIRGGPEGGVAVEILAVETGAVTGVLQKRADGLALERYELTRAAVDTRVRIDARGVRVLAAQDARATWAAQRRAHEGVDELHSGATKLAA